MLIFSWRGLKKDYTIHLLDSHIQLCMELVNSRWKMSRGCLATLWLNGWMQKGTGRKPNTLELFTIGGVPAMKEELQVKNAVSTTLIFSTTYWMI